MSDIDADLLALAGDDSESDVPDQTQQPTGGNDRDAPEASDDEVAMDESDGEAPEDRDSEPDELSKYPVEGKYKSEAERKEMMNMPEIEREQILAERAEEAIAADNVRKLRALRAAWDNIPADDGPNEEISKKRKASDSDLRDGRKSTRQKTVVQSSRSDQLAELRKSRAEREHRRAQPRASRQSETPDRDADADGESDGDYRGRRDQTPEELPATKKDFDRIKVGRQNLAKVCFHPGFEEAMVGCYVRVSIGPDPKNRNMPAYRMARIEGIVEKAPYSFPTENGKLQVTTQHIIASIGKTKRDAPFIHCSQSMIEPAEFEQYLRSLEREGLSPPKKSRLEAKTADLNALITHRFTNEELTVKLARPHKLLEGFKQRERERLGRQKAEAEQVGETDKAERIQESLDKVEKGIFKMAYNTTNPNKAATETPKKSEMTQQQRLAELNKKNLKSDREVIRKALLAEKAARERRKPAAAVNGTAVKTGPTEPPVHHIFNSKKGLELPYPEWSFNYVDFSNKYLGSRSMRHLTYDDKGRAICEWSREMCDDEVIARMDIPLTCIVPEYD